MTDLNKQNQNSKPFYKTKKKLILVLILSFCVCVIIIWFAVYIFNSFGSYLFNNSHNLSKNTIRDKRELEKVGSENIYNQALNMEYSYYPLPRNPTNSKKFLLKIAKDSIILQGGAQDGFITLNNTFFNAPTINYLKRMQEVNDVKESVESKENKISGSVIAIFFYNNKPGKIGYAKGKALAYSTIKKLYDAVVSGKMTTEQAGEAIENNTNLAAVDTEYKSNAYLPFTVTAQQAITYDPTFDYLIKKLQAGQTSPIYTGSDKDYSTGKMIDVVFMFAQVSAVKTNGTNENFDEWYAQKQKEYETSIY